MYQRLFLSWCSRKRKSDKGLQNGNGVQNRLVESLRVQLWIYQNYRLFYQLCFHFFDKFFIILFWWTHIHAVLVETIYWDVHIPVCNNILFPNFATWHLGLCSHIARSQGLIFRLISSFILLFFLIFFFLGGGRWRAVTGKTDNSYISMEQYFYFLLLIMLSWFYCSIHHWNLDNSYISTEQCFHFLGLSHCPV